MGKIKGAALLIFELLVILALASFSGYLFIKNNDLFLTADNLYAKLGSANKDKEALSLENASISARLKQLESDDQYKVNLQLKEKIAQTENAFKKTVSVYEQADDFALNKYKTEFSSILSYLSTLNYELAIEKTATLSAKISADKVKALATPPAANIVTNNTPPTNGFAQQRVKTSMGEFVVNIVTADLNTTKVIVETGNDGDCKDNCNVSPLADYVARSGAYAGVNGTYFCPASYPSCAGKTNSFDLLVMNKNKKYLNSDNNVYSTNPAVAFYGNNVRFMERASDWGRDTGVDAVLSNYPLLIMGNQIKFTGDGDTKHSNKGNRSFIAGNGSTAYIGVVLNATVAESASVMQSMGLGNAINLDDGGSTAMIANGRYIVGPGRAIPNAVLFVRK